VTVSTLSLPELHKKVWTTASGEPIERNHHATKALSSASIELETLICNACLPGKSFDI